MNYHVLNEYLMYSKDVMLLIYCKLFNLILDTGFIPEAWSKSTILPIYKNKGDIKDPDNYRVLGPCSILNIFLYVPSIKRSLYRFLLTRLDYCICNWSADCDDCFTF